MTLKTRLKWMVVLGAGFLELASVGANAGDQPALKTQQERESYSVGVDIAKNIKRQKIDLETEALLRGLRDGFSGSGFLLNDEELKTSLSEFQAGVKQKRAKAVKSLSEDNKKAGEAFLAENKTREGVVTLPSGLQYKILKAGEGKKPAEGDKVECNYRGSLIDGTEFDSSYRAGKSATFEMKGGIIPGWSEALKLMSEGSKWQIFIPSQLAYGEHGAGPYIGPNSTLIFEVELLAVKSVEAASQNK